MAEQLEPKSFGLAFGAMYGVFMLVLGLAATFAGYGVEAVNLIASMYGGFAPTVTGSVIGAVWGLVDGFILGFLLAWLYNEFQDRL